MSTITRRTSCSSLISPLPSSGESVPNPKSRIEEGSSGTQFSTPASSSSFRRVEIPSVSISEEEVQSLRTAGVCAPLGSKIEEAGTLEIPASLFQTKHLVALLQKLTWLRHLEIRFSDTDRLDTLELKAYTQLRGIILGGTLGTKVKMDVQEGVDISLTRTNNLTTKIKCYFYNENGVCIRSQTVRGVAYYTNTTVENYNGKRGFKDQLDTISCRHIALQYLLCPEDGMKRRKEDGTKYYKNIASYRNVEIFGEGGVKMWNWSYKLEEQCKTFITATKENHFVSNQCWEAFCQAHGREMREALEHSKVDRLKRAFMILSPNHAMVLRLGVKKKEDRISYSISFFDPNLTATDRRVPYDSIEDIGTPGSLFDNLLDKRHQKMYFGENAKSACALFLAVPASMTSEAIEAFKTYHSKRQVTYHGTIPLGCSFLYLAMYSNLLPLKTCQKIIEQHLASIKEDKARLVPFLKALNQEGIPGLYVALQNGHTRTITTYSAILHRLMEAGTLTPQDFKDLLSAKKSNGTPGLYIALQNGHTEAVGTYVAILHQLMEEETLTGRELKDLLMAKRSNGIPGLYVALQNGHTRTITTYLAILHRLMEAGTLTSQDFKDLLSAKSSEGTPGLSMALVNGHLEAAIAYLKKSDGSEFTNLRVFRFRRTLYGLQDGELGRNIYNNPEKLEKYLNLLSLLRMKGMINHRKLQQILISSSWIGHSPFFTLAQQNNSTKSANIFWKAVETFDLGREIPRAVKRKQQKIVRLHLPPSSLSLSQQKPKVITHKGTIIIPAPPRRKVDIYGR